MPVSLAIPSPYFSNFLVEGKMKFLLFNACLLTLSVYLHISWDWWQTCLDYYLHFIVTSCGWEDGWIFTVLSGQSNTQSLNTYCDQCAWFWIDFSARNINITNILLLFSVIFFSCGFCTSFKITLLSSGTYIGCL